MITKSDIQRLIHRVPSDKPVVSVYLDMSVNSENKRTYQKFLQQKRAEHSELDSDRDNHHREPLGAAFERIDKWIEAEYDQANRGVALFLETGGNWLEAIQLPVPVANRMVFAERPVIGPLAQLLARNHHFGVALVDRERCRLLDYFLGEMRQHKEIVPDAYPTSHDVKSGPAEKSLQSYKLEETHRFYKHFAKEIDEFDRRFQFDHWILLGTDENVKAFREFLTQSVEQRVTYTEHASLDASTTDILDRITPFFAEQAAQVEQSTINVLRERLRNQYFATAGVHDTLERLQEGKVGTLVMARDLDSPGAQCTRCGFYLDRRDGGCPYCGGELKDGVDLAESMIRIAAQQEIEVEFVDPRPMSELNGVAALLKF